MFLAKGGIRRFGIATSSSAAEDASNTSANRTSAVGLLQDGDAGRHRLDVGDVCVERITIRSPESSEEIAEAHTFFDRPRGGFIPTNEQLQMIQQRLRDANALACHRNIHKAIVWLRREVDNFQKIAIACAPAAAGMPFLQVMELDGIRGCIDPKSCGR